MDFCCCKFIDCDLQCAARLQQHKNRLYELETDNPSMFLKTSFIFVLLLWGLKNGSQGNLKNNYFRYEIEFCEEKRKLM